MKTNYTKSLLIALFLGASFTSYSQIITTIAGNGYQPYGYSGDGGQATAAELANPYGVSVDALGNVYIGDHGTSRVRKINTSGIISTFAGNGNAGFYGDGGQATAAELDYPGGIRVAASGNIYILDANRIRKVNTSGIISTIAGNGTMGFSGDGGQATAAELNGASDLAIDPYENLYIADWSNNRIRKVNTTGTISTFAGNGFFLFSGDGGQATAAELNGPLGVGLDIDGNLYIADAANNRIRKVNTSGIISTIAGNGTSGYTGDGGQATAAEIANPGGVLADASGKIYIIDVNNFRIRLVNTSGIISTFAGNGGQNYSGDGGPATAAEINEPAGIALDATGNLYLADSYYNHIRKVSPKSELEVSEISSESPEVNIYPVPNSGLFTIQLSDISSPSTVEIYNILGEKVYSQFANSNPQLSINISDKQNGIYLVVILNKNGEIVGQKKMIKTE